MSKDTNADSMADASTDVKQDIEPTSHTSSNWKVLGQTDASDGVGVLGHSTSGSGATTGVTGISDSSDVTATGVLGKAMGFTTTATFGVHGVTSSVASSGYGVLGEAPVPQNSSARGVGGITDGDGDGSTGVYGEAAATVDSATYGVLGKSAGVGTGASGVRGQAITATSTETYGVHGSSRSTAGYGVYSDGNSKTDGDHEVTGSQRIGNVGVSAHLTTNTTIGPSGLTTVPFDATNRDDFGGFDPSTGVYTVQETGDYHVSFTLRWADTFSDGDVINYNLRTGGDIGGQGFQAVTEAATSGQLMSGSFSRTVFGLTEGTTISVAVGHGAASEKDLNGTSQNTYLTVYKVG